jgi:hypothetical protein
MLWAPVSLVVLHSIAIVSARAALAASVLAVGWCCLHVRQLHSMTLRVAEVSLFALALAGAIVIGDLMIAAAAVLALLVAVAVPTAVTAAR